EDGLKGFEKANDLIPSLIITDVRMPGIDGFELSTRIKESTLTSHIPIIILTAKADQEDKLTGLKTGADEYLIKPFSAQELVLRVKNLISIRKKLREKYSKTGSFNPSQVTESSLDQKLLSKILEEINNNISDEKFTAEILAKNVAISVSQLNRKLNALIGQPAGQLIRTVRMEKAAKMLTNKEASIKEVAYSVGYSDQSNFARTFKKHFGKTPGEILPE
ncbi:MAG: helix-turn-helix domain-containing protein, partial [Ignavibacterium sp.]